MLNKKVETFGKSTILEKITCISINNLTFGYNDNCLISGLNTNFRIGLNVIYGANGSGKSTLIYLICGLYRVHKRKCIFFNGKEISELDIDILRREKIGIYMQNQTSMDQFVYEMLYDNMGIKSEEVLNLINENNLQSLYLRDDFNILLYMERHVKELSGGEMQRLCLLPVLTKDTDILIFDEPTSDLDDKSKKLLINILTMKSKDKIIIIITHDNYLFKDKKVNIINL